MKKFKKLSKLKILAMVTVLSLFSCEKDTTDDITTNENLTGGKLLEKYFQGDLVTVEDIGNGEFLYNSDIILSKEMLSDEPPYFDPERAPSLDSDQKLALYGSVRKWPNNTVIYKLGNLNSNLRAKLTEAFNRWSSKTNIKFKKHTNESYYVTIYESTSVCSGCGSASFGVRGTRGVIRLGYKASTSLIAHEIGHTLGFVHEQTRSDRDNYVKIQWQNIQSGKEGNFRKSESAKLLTDQFDIKSIMMYHAYGFSKNRKPTITLLNGDVYRGAQKTISPLDIAGTNKAYPDETNVDICDGVNPWESGQSYQAGDKVTYRGSLYELQGNLRWSNLGQCGN